MFVVPFSRYRNIVGKCMYRRAKTKEAVQRSVTTQTRKCYKGQEFIASGFSSRVQS